MTLGGLLGRMLQEQTHLSSETPLQSQGVLRAHMVLLELVLCMRDHEMMFKAGFTQ